jgi:uncharacterized protein
VGLHRITPPTGGGLGPGDAGRQRHPVCLAEGRAYNVDDALWAAILAQQDEAGRVRFLRCLEARKRVENWTLLGRQLANAGRFLLDLPKRALG